MREPEGARCPHSVAKGASDSRAFRREMYAFPNARTALGDVLRRVGVPERGGVLLPSYIGWSPREGSGVFDPIRELSTPYWFYPLDRNLRMDPESVLERVKRHRPRVLLVIHYFGFPDPNFSEIARMARDEGVVVVEDEAHAMYTDLVGGICGRAGDASVFSLHKMLPVEGGGVLVVNRQSFEIANEGEREPSRAVPPIAEYDLSAIAGVRIQNAKVLWRLLAPLREVLRPLWGDLPAGVVPQTLPVLLLGSQRDRVYEIMNTSGFGVVSLYHTMISEISSAEFPDAHWVSRHILNLPVHQDVRESDLPPMVERLALAVKEAGQ